MATFYTSNLVQTIRQEFSVFTPNAQFGIYYSPPSGYYAFLRNLETIDAGSAVSSSLWLHKIGQSTSQSLNLSLISTSLVENAERFSRIYPNGLFFNHNMAVSAYNNSGGGYTFRAYLDIDVYKII